MTTRLYALGLYIHVHVCCEVSSNVKPLLETESRWGWVTITTSYRNSSKMLGWYTLSIFLNVFKVFFLIV